jgi:FdhE protein
MASLGIQSSPRQFRIERAEQLALQVPAASTLLRFYIDIAKFQAEIYGLLESDPEQAGGEEGREKLPAIYRQFGEFLLRVARVGPPQLGEHAQALAGQGSGAWNALLDGFWEGNEPQAGDTQSSLLARAFLQPYAEFVRERARREWPDHREAACPFCGRKAGLAILRPLGDGAKRSLLCSFCQAEWDFRRLVCVACGEENDARLTVYTAEQFPEVRVECCESCKRYIKAVDLSKNGLAEPVVDEIASAALDLWAHEHGYAKWQVNLLGM